MRQALRIAGGVLAVGLVVYAVIAVSGGSGSTSKAPKRARVVESQGSEGDDGGDEGGSKRAVKKPARDRDAKRPLALDRKSVPDTAAATTAPAPVRYEDAHDEFVALVEEIEGMAARGEHLTQERFVEIYRKGDALSVALMRTPEVMASENVRSQLAKLNQRFRMKMTDVGPVRTEQ